MNTQGTFQMRRLDAVRDNVDNHISENVCYLSVRREQKLHKFSQIDA